MKKIREATAGAGLARTPPFDKRLVIPRKKGQGVQNFVIQGNEFTIRHVNPQNPWAGAALVPQLYGTMKKIIDTGHLEDDAHAALVAQAECERLKGEFKDPSLNCWQICESGVWTRRYLIGKLDDNYNRTS